MYFQKKTRQKLYKIALSEKCKAQKEILIALTENETRFNNAKENIKEWRDIVTLLKDMEKITKEGEIRSVKERAEIEEKEHGAEPGKELIEKLKQGFYGELYDEKRKAQEAAMAAAERMAEAVENGENAKPDAVIYKNMTREAKEWERIIKVLDNQERKQAGR